MGAFSQHYILNDETLGLGRSGIIRFQIPGDINNGNTLIVGEEERSDLYWIRASATEIPENKVLVDALPKLKDIHPQAGTAVFQNNNNTLEHLLEGLAAEEVTQLEFGDVNVKKIEQPYPSVGGRLPESGDRLSYYRRINERLRHRSRAVTVYDYERLALEYFPKIARVKTLPHTAVDYVCAPGCVTVAVIPYPKDMIGNGIYYPTVDAGDLEAVRLYLACRNSYFVGGYGGYVDCCCCKEEEPKYEYSTSDQKEKEKCCCHEPGCLYVLNPRFEPVRIKVCVRFKKGKDIPFYTKQLNEDLKKFLAPWATDDTQPILFGATIHTTQLLQFVELLDYIDVVMDLKIKHFLTRADAESIEPMVPWSTPEFVEPFTARSILTTYLDILNEDNPNVIDHKICVIEDSDPCKCPDCEKEKPKEITPSDEEKEMRERNRTNNHRDGF